MNNQVEEISGKPKYRQENLQFYQLLGERVNDFFEKTGLSRKGGTYIITKGVFIFSLYISSYLLMLESWNTLTVNLIFALVFGAANVLIVFNIAHDAAHNALFKNKNLNKVLAYSFNLVGTSSYLWNLTHNKIHHAFPNVGDYDSDIEQQAPYIRVSPTVEWKPIHKYQSLYAIFLYLTYSIFLIFIKDFRGIGLFPNHESKLLEGIKHPRKELVIFYFSKILYFCFTIVIPFIMIDATIFQFIVGYLSVHVFMSTFLSVVLIPVHMVDEATFAIVNEEGKIEDGWAIHVLKNTTDYSSQSRLANFLFGGLNTHTVHHLFPKISHANYIKMSEILKNTALEFGLPYRNFSMWGAIRSHFRLLERMGKKPRIDSECV
jgi:linoleoyl-CoA desaturase